MRSLLILLLTTAALAQAARQTQSSNTSEDLRGVSAVSLQIAWASGTHGAYLRTTDAGRNWIPAQVPGAEMLDFRAVVAFSANEAFLMSAGPGDQSRIYHTTDAGLHWQLQSANTNPKAFFDCMVFWDRTHGVVLGDPFPDEAGQLKFELLTTDDGRTWTSISPSQLPPALDGEGAFAASNTALAILTGPPAQPWKSGASAPRQPGGKDGTLAPEVSDPNIWFATGGRTARVFHSPDRGRTWQVFSTPITHGPDSAGIFSIAFRDPLHGVIVGGDYKHPDQEGPNLAFTNDGGQTWSLSKIYPQSYYSAVAYDRKYAASNASSLEEDQARVRLFVVAPKFIFDFRPTRDPTRISPPKKSGIHFNAVSPYPTGGAVLVGPHGSIATIP